MNLVILSVGSNIDPLTNVTKAAEMLAEINYLISVSRFMKTSPEGNPDQPDFLNGAFYIKTGLDQVSLKDKLKDMEAKLGRTRSSDKNGPRTIDLDIVVFNGEVTDPDYERYIFVKKSVNEIFDQIRSKKWKRKIEVE
ncbi:MAG: 2-amino-4-hydroxy-6-hydroxymethyldihydropteridine diphosphokinase [Acidobacteriota bacterium]